MRLSFIVPVYKPKIDVFEKHLNALKVQALEDWEVIFVLDGPDTEAWKAISRVFQGDMRVRVYKIDHAGAQAARNFGGALANGDFLCFFDCDCIIEPGTSKMWVEQFDKRPEIGFIYSGYKFFGDKYAIDSEQFDPWTLRVRNYISGCFPMRKELYPGWAPELKSLQDWDMWLSLLEKAEAMGKDISKLGFFVAGYGFSTALADPESISGKGCTPEVWLERVDAVKKRHNLPERDICVSSLQNKHDGIALAKLIDADYQDFPADKPHRYKTMIQVGFSLGSRSEKHAAIFQKEGMKNVIFWTGDNINEIYNAVSFRQIDAMSQVLNKTVKQYVEDIEAKRLMVRAGFEVEVMSLPLGEAKPKPMPKEKKWVVDISGQYSQLFTVIEQSLPDIPLEIIGNTTKMSDYTGFIHFFPDRSLSTSVKRAHLNGRHVISNIQQPFCGFIDDKFDYEKFIIEVVEKVRYLNNKEADPEAPDFYSKKASELLEALRISTMTQ